MNWQLWAVHEWWLGKELIAEFETEKKAELAMKCYKMKYSTREIWIEEKEV